MTQYGTIYSDGETRLSGGSTIVGSGPTRKKATKSKSGCTSSMSAKRFQKLISSKLRRHDEEGECDSNERVGLCTAEAIDDDERVSIMSEAQLRAKHRKMRKLWKGIVEAVTQQFYFMTVSIENSGGIYRATTVTRSDGTIATELHYVPSPKYVPYNVRTL